MTGVTVCRDKTQSLVGRSQRRNNGNSGFIVTGAVGLGYNYGMQWMLLPLSWMLGDFVFWYFFPARVNEVGRESHATTLSELLTHGIRRIGMAMTLLTALIIFACLGVTLRRNGSPGNNLRGAFALPPFAALWLVCAANYSLFEYRRFSWLGLYRHVEAFIRIIGTIIALVAVGEAALADALVPGAISMPLVVGFWTFFPAALALLPVL